MLMKQLKPRLMAIVVLPAIVIIVIVSLASNKPVFGSLQSAYLYTQVRPFAVFADADEKFTIEVAVIKNVVEHVALGHVTPADAAEIILVDGVSYVRMYDDGTHGDRVAGDGIYTLEVFAKPFIVASFDGCSTWGGDIFIIHKGALKDPGMGYTGDLVERQTGATIGLVDPGQKGKFALTKLAEDIYATDYAVFIVDRNNLLLPGFPQVEVACFDTDFMVAAAKKLYSVYPDIFDFLTFMPGGTMYDPRRPNSWGGLAENVPFFVGVSQQVENIGLPLFDNSQYWGSEGRLKGAIYHSFGSLAIMAHEVGHNWGVSYGSDFGLIIGTDPHWVSKIALNDYDTMAHYFFSGDAAYHFRYQNNQIEAILNYDQMGHKRAGYSDLTLYLMGLMPADEVEPVRILVNPKVEGDNILTVTADEIKVITMEQLIAAEGERVPSYRESQKDFNMAFVVITQDVPTDAEAAFFSLLSSFFGSQMDPELDTIPFYAATRGLGTMNTNFKKALGIQVAAASTETEADPGEMPDPEELPDPANGTETPESAVLWIYIIPAAVLLAGGAGYMIFRKVKK